MTRLHAGQMPLIVRLVVIAMFFTCASLMTAQTASAHDGETHASSSKKHRGEKSFLEKGDLKLKNPVAIRAHIAELERKLMKLKSEQMRIENRIKELKSMVGSSTASTTRPFMKDLKKNGKIMKMKHRGMHDDEHEESEEGDVLGASDSFFSQVDTILTHAESLVANIASSVDASFSEGEVLGASHIVSNISSDVIDEELLTEVVTNAENLVAEMTADVAVLEASRGEVLGVSTTQRPLRIDELKAQVYSLQEQITRIVKKPDYLQERDLQKLIAGLLAQIAAFPPAGTSTGITVTAPNGGEQWETNSMNTITWSPYSYNPDVNPSRDVIAYLEKKTEKGFVVVGKIIPSGKASIHWEGEIESEGKGKRAQPGTYYIRVVNTRTGSWDRSDMPFTIVQSVDLKLNGSDGPVLTDGGMLTATWSTTGMSQCTLANAYTDATLTKEIGMVKLVGTRSVYVPSNPNHHVTLYCSKTNGTTVYDSVQVNPKTSPASVQVQSPNGGEQVVIGQPYNIQWKQTGLKNVSIALYSNDQWKQWIVKDFSTQFPNDSYIYQWTPTQTDTNIARFKIYITGQKADGSGYVDDKSDAPFSFVASGTTTNTYATAIAVGAYEGTYPTGITHSFNNHPQGSVTVYIPDPGTGYKKGSIVLSLSSYEPVKWNITGPGAGAIGRVFTTGYYKQEVTGVTVPIDTLTWENKSATFFYPYQNSGDQFTKLNAYVKSKYGVDIQQFIGSYTLKEAKFTGFKG